MQTDRFRRTVVLLAAAVATMAAGGGCERESERESAHAPVAAAGSPAASAGPAAPSATSAPRPGGHLFPMSMAPVLDDPQRDEWQRPDDVVGALSIRPGERIADVGCGTGYFTLRLLRATGATGHVVAVDVQQGMLDILERRLDADAKTRVTLRRNAPDRPLDRSDAVDLVLCANTLYEVGAADVAQFVQSMADGLAPGGRLAVVDWRPTQMRLGPPLEVRMTPARVRELALRAGLAPSQDVDLLPTHMFLVFTKPAGTSKLK
ncbi:MAG: class I SAM-dependent methyltransferase [Planctomycetes bacterium]|nr:class I SAM-dependent methyltransferase [Planctomycetota bacterium]